MAEPGLEEVRLVLVGEGPARAAILERSRELGLEGRVSLPGPRPHDRIPELLAAFDVGLIPAINDYASPLKLHEYMAAGLPVVAPRQANILEVVEDRHSALVFGPGEGSELGAALGLLAGDRERRREMGARAREVIVARDLTWRGNARRVLEAVALP